MQHLKKNVSSHQFIGIQHRSNAISIYRFSCIYIPVLVFTDASEVYILGITRESIMETNRFWYLLANQVVLSVLLYKRNGSLINLGTKEM